VSFIDHKNESVKYLNDFYKIHSKTQRTGLDEDDCIGDDLDDDEEEETAKSSNVVFCYYCLRIAYYTAFIRSY
jgi:hypothetical protein